MKFRTISLIFVTITFMFSCRTTQIQSEINYQSDNKYDSEFPDESVSKTLKNIAGSVKKLDVIAFYGTYYFPEKAQLLVEDINDSLIKAYKRSMIISHETVSGTATVIYKSQSKVGLLTCSHVIDFPDTLYTYSDKESKIVQTLSVRIKQQIHISGIAKGEAIEVVAKDKKHDIALLAKNTEEDDYNLKVLNFPRGNSSDLQWGSIVYIMGFPLNNLMVTRALVSINEKMKSGFFTTDALYNHGISGSPVFAMRDGATNFELVGMASSSSAQSSRFLVPENNTDSKFNPLVPYDGNIFVDNSKLINYGVTFSVTINEIVNFIHSNEALLTEKGFYTNNFFN